MLFLIFLKLSVVHIAVFGEVRNAMRGARMPILPSLGSDVAVDLADAFKPCTLSF